LDRKFLLQLGLIALLPLAAWSRQQLIDPPPTLTVVIATASAWTEHFHLRLCDDTIVVTYP
jgi:hypothetical protein